MPVCSEFLCFSSVSSVFLCFPLANSNAGEIKFSTPTKRHQTSGTPVFLFYILEEKEKFAWENNQFRIAIFGVFQVSRGRIDCRSLALKTEAGLERVSLWFFRSNFRTSLLKWPGSISYLCDLGPAWFPFVLRNKCFERRPSCCPTPSLLFGSSGAEVNPATDFPAGRNLSG